MKKGLLFFASLAVSLTIVAQTTFPVKFTTADGLPEQTSAAASSFTEWMSPVLTFAEPVSSFRMTVTHTSWQDAYNTSTNGGRGYIFFTMGEFYLKDAAGNAVTLTADNFYGNATESPDTNDGVIGNLCDGDVSTHYHTLYSKTDEPRPIGQEYYLEVTLPEPMTSFSFGFHKRSNNANIPSEIILTAAGVDADPYPEYGFELGEAAATLEANNLYVFCDNQIAWEGAEEQLTVWLATGKDTRFASPAGTDKYYRIRKTPNFDCVFKAIPTDEEGKFYMQSLLGGSYIKTVAETDGSVFIEQATDISDAAKLYLDEDGYLVCNNHYYSLNSQETLVAYDAARRFLHPYKANINNTFLIDDLKSAIATGDKAIADFKAYYAEQNADQGETAALEAALTAAKAITTTSESSAILTAQSELEAATKEFLSVRIYMFVDEINDYLDKCVFDNTKDNYPAVWEPRLAQLLETVQTDLDTKTFITVGECQNYINTVQAQIDEFVASKIEGYTEWPMTIVAPEGVSQLGTLVKYPNESSNTDKYVYNSPTFVFEQPVEQFCVTFVHTNNGDNGGGWECTALSNFAIFDGEGNEVDLSGEDFYCNAPEVDNANDSGPLSNLCDKNDDGTPNVTTYFHTKWSKKDLSTNEHYLSITLPQSLACFSFQYITRGTGIAPREIVVDYEPYHYVPTETIEVKKQITTVAELDPDKYYIFWGNIERVSAGSEGTGYYAGTTSTYGEIPMPQGVFQLVPADGGGYKIHFLVEDYYLTQPGGWEGHSTTGSPEVAGVWFFEESPNLADAFKVYAEGTYTGDLHDVSFQNEAMPIVLQDWSGSMGYYPVSPRGWVGDAQTGGVVEATTKWDFDDTDGESDWYIFETAAPSYAVAVTDVKKASELNTEDLYAMYGNLGKLNSAAGSPGGYYRGVTAAGAKATNYTLFKLENGSTAGTYKIHFVEDDVYLKNPTGWASMELTTNADEAADLYFEESTRLNRAFWIYTKAKFTGQNASEIDYVDADAMYRLQDWGEYGMGVYPIVKLEEDDTDGESDWFIRKVYDVNSVVLNRDDYLGEWTYYWDNNWNKFETKSFDFNFLADPDNENGLIMDCYDADKNNQEGPWKGVLDPVAHTITFQGGQVVYEGNDQWLGVVRTTGGADKDIVFTIDLVNDAIYYNGNLGIVYDPREEGQDGGGWWMLSFSKVWLVQKTHNDPDKVEETIMDAGEVIATEFYNLKGQRIAAPEKGVNIIRRVYDNGV
ncbi:MAG: hypothetical protein J5814_00595, partial [Bacteroidaceae bacterium]|nr:hypothetical protein [Bacteroidaceae bacterium]